MGAPPLYLTHVLAPAPIGGLELVVTTVIRGMKSRGHHVRVVALLDARASGEALASMADSGAEVIEIRLPRRSYRAEYRRLAAELSKARGTVVHTHGYHADLVGLAAARAAGCPILSTAHGFTAGGPRNRLYEWLDRKALRRFDAVIAVSRPLRARLLRAGVQRERIHLVPNAYPASSPILSRAEARARLGIPSDAVVAGWVGRLSHEKGPDLMLQALTEAPEWQVSVMGSGPLLESLQSRSRKLGVESRVRWHGVVPEAGTLLRAFDAFLLSSRTEGTPMVVLEAMAAGVPLVVLAVGGVPDVVTHREAELVPLERASLLAEVLQAVRTHPEVAAQKAAKAQERLREAFALEPWLDRYETIYRNLRS